ncbi:MAG: hypothetical protein E6Q06_04965 [Candidatus Moraniibacteriota bacterium]|nr:MAG: hypothetical protein E6Q06_04965 [Candidatus Moranbacteria bacterium]
MSIFCRLKDLFRQMLALPLGASLLFAMPASTNYQLKDFGYGGGGVANGTSSNYAIEGIAGEQNAGNIDGTNYDLGPGLQFTNQANVPPAPTFANPANYYNKLSLTLATGGNPSDTLFAIAISTDNFVTTNYVQSDNTVGTTLGLEDYQTYSAWGGASGFTVIGLAASTTYKVKVKAWQGKFTETGYGPEASAATVGARLTFDIDVSASNTETSPPYATNIGSLVAGTVTDSPEKIWVDFDTNGESGGRVYVVASNAGLSSSRAAYTISAVTGNLTSLSEGFGAQSDTVANGLSEVALYDQTGNTVGTVDTTIREVFTASAPTTSGRGSFLLKAKSSSVTPAASDYTEVLTVLASASF